MAKDFFNLSRTSGLSAIKLQSPVGGLIEQHRHAEKKVQIHTTANHLETTDVLLYGH